MFRIFLALCLLLPGQADAWFHPGAASHPANWYNSAWGFRKAITIDHTKVSTGGGETYVGFPVLFSEGTDADLAAHAQVSGNDILFTAGDGITKLNHEIESYTSASGKILAWLKVPGLSTSVDTGIYIYYGNPSATDQQNVAGTWDANFKGVYHLGSKDKSLAITRYAGNPIINVNGGNWEDSQVYDPNIMEDPNNSNNLVMFYTGMAAPVTTGHECIGRATAAKSNPYLWTQYASNPIICDASNRRVDSVIYTGGTYYMFSTNDTAQQIELYTSTDGFNFTNVGVVLTPTGQGRNDGNFVSQGAVWLEGGVWTMIYAYRTAVDVLPGYRYATSSTGLPGSWTKGGSGDILSRGIAGSADSQQLEFHSISKIGSTYVLVYEAFNNITYWICAAYSTSLTSGWVKSGANPIFQQSFIPGSFDQFQAATPAFFEVNGVWYFMYAGGNNANYSISKYPLAMATLSGTPLDAVIGGIKDSTSNANDLVGINMTATTGKIDGAFTFDGLTAKAGSITTASSATNNYTMELWTRPASLSQQGIMVMNGLGNVSGAGSGEGYGMFGSGGVGSEFYGYNANVAFMDSGSAFGSTSVSVKADMIRNAGTTSFYLNNSVTPTTSGSTPNTPGSSFLIGSATGSWLYNGDIDEVRFSDVVRSSGWLATGYTNQNAPSSFYSIGAETPY